MAQKRMLVIGTIVVAAAIGAPTAAMLAPDGGDLAEPTRSVADPADPDPAVPVEPAETNPPAVESGSAPPAPIQTTTTIGPAARHLVPAPDPATPARPGVPVVPRRTTVPPQKPVTQPGVDDPPPAAPPDDPETDVVPPPKETPEPDDPVDAGPPPPPEDDTDPFDQ